MIDYDDELRALYSHLRAAAAVARGERVLDIGCGAGQTTRDAARAAAPAPVLGVDISEALLARARSTPGPDNATYVLADAQTHPFPDAEFDVAISRFGTMFFADPAAAFANIARALRPAARLVMLVWQPYARNEWAVEIDRALGVRLMETDVFSLGDPTTTTEILERAELSEIRFDAVHEPVFYGPDSDAALEFVNEFQTTRDALAGMSADDADRALERLRRMLDDHRTADDGVAVASSAWIVTARR